MKKDKKKVSESDESVENLLKQLRDSQGPGDALIEIHDRGFNITTNDDIPEEVLKLIRNYFTEMDKFEQIYGTYILNKAYMKVVNEFENS